MLEYVSERGGHGGEAGVKGEICVYALHKVVNRFHDEAAWRKGFLGVYLELREDGRQR